MMEKSSLLIWGLQQSWNQVLVKQPFLSSIPFWKPGVIILPTQTIHHSDGNPLKITIKLYEIDWSPTWVLGNLMTPGKWRSVFPRLSFLYPTPASAGKEASVINKAWKHRFSKGLLKYVEFECWLLTFNYGYLIKDDSFGLWWLLYVAVFDLICFFLVYYDSKWCTKEQIIVSHQSFCFFEKGGYQTLMTLDSERGMSGKGSIQWLIPKMDNS